MASAFLALLAIAAAQSRPPSAAPDPPQVLFKDLFIAVQTAQIFPDGKLFPDAIPNAAPDQILKDYEAERPDSPAALKQFVEAHFTLPAQIGGAPSPPDTVSIVAHIDGLWNPLTRKSATAPPFSSLLTLPAPYVVPGGRFREMYYWDSYFTMLGFADSGRQDLLTGMVRDFAAAVLLCHGRIDFAQRSGERVRRLPAAIAP
jgi:alpha,alpha-trehalase